MISTLIVVGALVLAAAFSLAWLLRPALRRQIEEPSHRFAAQAQQYDKTHQDVYSTRSSSKNDND